MLAETALGCAWPHRRGPESRSGSKRGARAPLEAHAVIAAAREPAVAAPVPRVVVQVADEATGRGLTDRARRRPGRREFPHLTQFVLPEERRELTGDLTGISPM